MEDNSSQNIACRGSRYSSGHVFLTYLTFSMILTPCNPFQISILDLPLLTDVPASEACGYQSNEISACMWPVRGIMSLCFFVLPSSCRYSGKVMSVLVYSTDSPLHPIDLIRRIKRIQGSACSVVWPFSIPIWQSSDALRPFWWLFFTNNDGPNCYRAPPTRQNWFWTNFSHTSL